ncbi:LrgB family protein, partial [Seohaeicola saemankumensis]
MSDLLSLALGQPLFAVCITVAAYASAEALWRKTGQIAIFNPVLIATIAISGFLLLYDLSYEDYLHQAQPINEMLAILVILLAVPLARQFRLIREVWVPLSLALLTGSIVALTSALALPVLMGADGSLIATIAPKAATTPVAVELATRLGGVPGLTAVIVISSGIFGAAFGPFLLEAGGVRDERAKGFALGMGASAIGT